MGELHIDDSMNIIYIDKSLSELNMNYKTLNDIFKLPSDFNINIELDKKESYFIHALENNRVFHGKVSKINHSLYKIIILEITETMANLRKINHDLKNISNLTGAILFLHGNSQKMAKFMESIKSIDYDIKGITDLLDTKIIIK
jgi:hypothetical protein